MIRFSLLTLLTALLLGGPGFADTAPSLDDASAYFNATRTLETRFIQYNDDGSQASGILYLSRPGKLRMEYEAGSNGGLLMVGGGSVAIFDDRGDSSPQRYSLRMTPLAPILARHVDLARAEEVVGQEAGSEMISVYAQDPDHPERGMARFTHSGDPLALTSWTMVNGSGETARIVFEGEARVGHNLPYRLFAIHREIEKRTPWSTR